MPTYSQEQVFKPIEVIAHFHNMKVNIRRFKWEDRVYKVDHVANVWRIPDNEEGFISHYSVVCHDAGIICELSFFHKSMKWEIVQYDTLDWKPD